MTSEVKWYGDQLLKAIRDATSDALFVAGELLIDVAASKAPRSSGDLAESGYVSSKSKSTYRAGKNYHKEVKAKEGEVVAGFAAFYARFLELGTKNMAAKAFLRPALDETKDKLLQTIAEHARKVLK